MRLHELVPFEGERKQKKRVGRGPASGWGCTCGKGHKGQNSRSGGGVPAWFEGGQMPLARRLPKRGFTNRFRVRYEVINLGMLSKAFGDVREISLDDIYSKGLARQARPVKILGDGEVIQGVSIEAHCFSQAAQKKITDAGGTASALEG